MSVRAVLLDVEGTTTPISFVTETLFPYARQYGREFILNHVADEEIRRALLQLRVDNDADRRDGAPAIEDDAHDAIESTIRYYFWLMDADRKSTALKTIQGRIWHDGYARGELQSTIFPDVLPAIERPGAIHDRRAHPRGRRLPRHGDRYQGLSLRRGPPPMPGRSG